MTLLQRLANIGMGQKPAAEETAEGGAELPSFLKARDTASASESIAKSAERKTPEVSEYFKRPASTRAPAIEASTSTRPTPPARTDEDELEIPAFLRRQAI